MQLVRHNGKLIENVWLEPLLRISKVTTTLLFPLLHSFFPPSTPRQRFGSPQRIHFSGVSLPLYKMFKIFCENTPRIIFIKFFKPSLWLSRGTLGVSV